MERNWMKTMSSAYIKKRDDLIVDGRATQMGAKWLPWGTAHPLEWNELKRNFKDLSYEKNELIK